MEKVTFKNSFHNSETILIPKFIHNGEILLNRRQIKRMEKALCGNSDCKCKKVTSVSIDNWGGSIWMID